VARRRDALERLVAGLAPEGLAVARWDPLLSSPGLANGFRHLVAFDPPPVPTAEVPATGTVHLAWGPGELEFAHAVWCAELELRPALAEVFRSLRDAGGAAGDDLRGVLCGEARYPRSPAVCGRVLRILVELGLAEYEACAAGGPRCVVLDVARTELERSPAYRAYLGRLERARHAHAVAPRAPVVAAARA
jgi:hypothetical protein